MTKAEVTYTTADGVEHVEVFDLALHPIVSLESLSVDGVQVPLQQVRVFEE